MSGKYALIIGNTEYTDPGLAQLTAPGEDTEDFAHILGDKDTCAFDEVKVLLDQISSSVIEAIDEFFDQRKPDDLLVLYFSGHGVRDEFGSLFLAVRNTIRSRLRSTAIRSDYIREAMDQSRSKRQVLILDCCNSGAFAQGTKAEVGGVMGLTTAFQGYGRFVLTASDATQFAWEGNKVIGDTKNSLFTHFLMKGLQGEADSDSDGRITVDELYDYAFEQISKVTPKQTPTKSASRQEGEIVLRHITRMEDVKPAALPAPLIDSMENPLSDIRIGAVQQLTKLLSGKNLGLARSAKEALEQMAEEDDSRTVSRAALKALQASREAEQKAKEEAERLLAEQKAEEEQKTREEAKRLAALKVEEERIAKARIEADQLAEEKRRAEEKAEAERKAKEEVERFLAEQKEKKERKAREEAERFAALKVEEERIAKARMEAEHLAEEKRRAEEKAEAERRAKEAAEQLLNERKAAERKAQEEAERIAALQVEELNKKNKATRPSWFAIGATGVAGITICILGFAAMTLLPGIFGPPAATEAPTSDYPTQPLPVDTQTPEPTQTPEATSTSTPVPTLTPTPSPVLSTIFNTFQDSFSDNSNNWTVGEINGDFFVGQTKVENGIYTIESTETKKNFVIGRGFSAQEPIRDFNMEVKAKVLSGDTSNVCYGIEFRYNDNGYYNFAVCDTQKYKVRHYNRQTSEWTDLQSWTSSEAIKPGEWNTLGIKATGGTFVFYINDNKVSELIDQTESQGRIYLDLNIYDTVPGAIGYDDFALQRVFYDDFSSNDNSWSTATADNDFYTGQAKLENGIYILESTETKKKFVSSKGWTSNQSIKNFSVSVKAKLLSGDSSKVCYGIEYHYNDNGYSIFTVCDTQSYKVSHYDSQSSKWTFLQEWTRSEAIKPGDWNTLAITAIGDTVTFFINGEKVVELVGQEESEGRIYLAIDIYDTVPGSVGYDDFTLMSTN